MSESSSRTNVNANNEDSDRSCPSSKRRCQSPNSRRSLSNPSSCVFVDLIPDDIDENKERCHRCGKQEKLLKTFHCPSTHCFCLNCIFIWTQDHVQNKTSPRCLVVDCDYLLKVEDLDDLPIAIKDHQVLHQLVDLKPTMKNKDSRIKCGKCELYIDQHNFYIHQNECLGRSLTIPCEICYCPVSIDDYEQHMIICNNDNNTALVQFLVKHLQNPNIDEKNVKSFINAWQRKHRQTIDVYEMIEQFNQPIVSSNDLCEVCKKTVPSEDFYSINCDNGHSLCLGCYGQHLQGQMNTNQILTCYKCPYHLQDRDLSEIRVLTNEQINHYQNYQNQKLIELYTQLYGNEDAVNVDPTLEQQNETVTTTTTTSTNEDDIPRRKCEICSKQHSYSNIFLLHCNCKICYDCFANEVNRQRTVTNEMLICVLCRASIKRNDLANLRLPQAEIDAIQLYQQGKLFELEHAVHFSQQRSTNQSANNTNDNDDDSDFDILLINQQQCLPKYWTLPMLTNFSRHTLDPQSTEYKFVLNKFTNSWTHLANQQAAFPPLYSTRNPAIPVRQPSAPPPSLAHFMLPLLNQQPAIRQRQPLRSTTPAYGNSNSTAVVNPMLLPPTTTVPAAVNQIPPQGPYFGPPWSQSLFTPSTTSNVPQAHFSPQIQPSPITNAPQAHFPTQGQPSVPVPYTQTNVYNQRSMMHARRQAPRPPPPLPGLNPPTIIQIERIQNQRWYKQYSAHDCEFRQKLGKQTEQWLFHGCDEQASKNIEMECFNRSYAGQRAVAYGQGSYFARDSLYSHNYAAPDRNGIRRMFLARVLVGNTVQGNSTMRVPPPGFDTTGDGHNIFVTYHDSQAYAEYLISYR